MIFDFGSGDREAERRGEALRATAGAAPASGPSSAVVLLRRTDGSNSASRRIVPCVLPDGPESRQIKVNRAKSNQKIIFFPHSGPRRLRGKNQPRSRRRGVRGCLRSCFPHKIRFPVRFGPSPKPRKSAMVRFNPVCAEQLISSPVWRPSGAKPVSRRFSPLRIPVKPLSVGLP
jgi:hypothetical protein